MFAVKGAGGNGRPFVSRPTRNNNAGVRLFIIGTDTGKDLIYSRLRIQEPGPGYCHFPHERDVAFFSQLTAERLVTRYFKGQPVRKWELKAKHARNEALDCRVYAHAALEILNTSVDRLAKKLLQRAETLRAAGEAVAQRQVPEASEAPPTTAKPAASPVRKIAKAPRPRRGFVTNWRGDG